MFNVHSLFSQTYNGGDNMCALPYALCRVSYDEMFVPFIKSALNVHVTDLLNELKYILNQ